MPDAQPAPVGGPLPRGHLLALNRSFRRPLQEFIADQLVRWKPATAHNRYRGLHAFFKWAVVEGDLQSSPMDGMKPPQLPEQPVEAVRPEHLTRLLKICEGRDFTNRRDTAILRLFCCIRGSIRLGRVAVGTGRRGPAWPG
jgi:site-specific recombinase XerC